MTNEDLCTRIRTASEDSHVLLRQILRADVQMECCTGPERGSRIQMYHSRKLSGVPIKTAGILEQSQPTEQAKYAQACDKNRAKLVILIHAAMFIVNFCLLEK